MPLNVFFFELTQITCTIFAFIPLDKSSKVNFNCSKSFFSFAVVLSSLDIFKVFLSSILFFGLFLSVVLIGAAASYFAKYIQDHQWVGYVGLVVILIIAIQLIIGGLMGYGVLTIHEPFSNWF